MKKRRMFRNCLLPLVLLACGSASAQIEGPAAFSIDRHTVDGGGGTSTGGKFSLSGTIGQFDATPSGAQGGAFTVVGGFWGGQVEFHFEDGFEN